MTRYPETFGELCAIIARVLVLCFSLWVSVDYVWYLRGWIVVPPQCVLESNRHRVYDLEGEMTPTLAQGLLDYLGRFNNPAAMRLNEEHQVEVRVPLYYLISPGFGNYLKGAVQLIEDEDGPQPFQSPPISCARLEGYLVPWTKSRDREMRVTSSPGSIYVIVIGTTYEERRDLVDGY